MVATKLNYVILLSLLVSGGCISDIEFDVPGEVQNAIVIQAKVVKGDPSLVSVQVAKAFDFTGASRNIFVSEAILKNISSGQALSLESTEFNARGAMIPEGDPNMSINYTDEYTLTVKSAAGEVFTSSPEILHAVPEADSMTYEYRLVETITDKGRKTYEDRLQYKVNTSTVNQFNELTRMRWTFEHIFAITDVPERTAVDPKMCYVTENLGALEEININPKELGVERLTDFKLVETILTTAYAEGSYFQAVQHSLSAEAYSYFVEVQELISREGGIFDPPAGQVRTNFKRSAETTSDVFGYFYLTDVDTVRVFVDPNKLDLTVIYCAPRGPLKKLEICEDCVSAENSTDIKPDWWVD